MSVLLVVLITFIASARHRSRDFISCCSCFSLVTVVDRTPDHASARRTSLNAHAVTSQVTLIAGTNDEARALARTLQRRPWMGYRVCGFVEVTQSGLAVMDGLPVFGTVDDIAQISTRAQRALGDHRRQRCRRFHTAVDRFRAQRGHQCARLARSRQPRRGASHPRADRRHGALLVAPASFLATPAPAEAHASIIGVTSVALVVARAVHARDRPGHQAHQPGSGAVQAAARRCAGARVHHPEVPHHGRRCARAARRARQRGGRPAVQDAPRSASDQGRTLPAQDIARRAAAAVQRACAAR